ncbi:PGF-CTERM sorting domain-containing protein [Halobellus marinus]|uniref:PGF-CTERM sorting domain-containing protein n=1 Tax=Halobellus TaxID=1073986 RepID=UPI0028AE2095|nr:PGF-CTERM sorting domain-containing protein [Halobellus sp. DFY28]
MTVEEINDLPEGTPEPPGRTRAATVDISAPDPTDGTATVQINVRRASISDDVDPSGLTINHYIDGEWREFETTVDSTSSDQIVVEAQTDRFSPFAVTYQQQTVTPEPTTDTPEPDTDTATARQTTTDTGTPGFGIVVAIIALLAAALLAARRRTED